MKTFNLNTSDVSTDEIENYFHLPSGNIALTLSDGINNSISCHPEFGKFSIELKIWKLDLSDFEYFHTCETKSAEQAKNLFLIFHRLSRAEDAREILNSDDWREGTATLITDPKARRRKLKEPYREQRKSEGDNCEEFLIESRRNQRNFENTIAEQRKNLEQAKLAESHSLPIFNIIKIAFVCVLGLAVIWLISRWNSDYTASSPSVLKGAQDCYAKLNTRLNQVEYIYLRPMSSNEKIKELIQNEKNDLASEIEAIKADISRMKNQNEIRKDRLSFTQYNCDPERVIGRYANRIDKEQEALDQERLARDETEINQAMSDVLARWEKKSVKHYVSNGAGPRVDTFVLQDGSSVLCTTSFRNGIRAVSCNR